MPSSPSEFEVHLTGLTYGGDAIGRSPDGRAVFVPFALPGEIVRVRPVDEKRGHIRAVLVEVLNPSSDRIQPLCPHFGTCGGCHYQHMPYQAQLQAKTDILREQLQRVGKIEQPPVQPCIPSPLEWNYRNHMQFHQDHTGRLGFLASDTHTVVPISECHLPVGVLNTIWPELDFDSDPLLERIELRAGKEDEISLVLVSRAVQPSEMTLDLPISVVFRGSTGPYVLAGDDTITMEVMGKDFQVSSGSFFQVNTPQAGNMVQFLLDSLPLTSGTILLDVYCGVGLFSAFLAERVEKLVGIEISPESCTDFAVNLDVFDNVELYQGPAENILPSLNLKPDVVVCDPPRSGLERRALDAILAVHPPTLAYVSCDPATLARDLKLFIQGGYSLRSVTPFDLFPQTYHIESISILQLNR